MPECPIWLSLKVSESFADVSEVRYSVYCDVVPLADFFLGGSWVPTFDKKPASQTAISKTVFLPLLLPLPSLPQSSSSSSSSIFPSPLLGRRGGGELRDFYRFVPRLSRGGGKGPISSRPQNRRVSLNILGCRDTSGGTSSSSSSSSVLSLPALRRGGEETNAHFPFQIPSLPKRGRGGPSSSSSPRTLSSFPLLWGYLFCTRYIPSPPPTQRRRGRYMLV